MTSMEPLVSIGMPVYNGAYYLREALDSLLTQDYSNFELIISDNASTDETWEICEEYAARDGRVACYQADRNMGAAWNFNRVFELSGGEFFMWAAHDDLWHPSFVTRCVQALQSHPEAAVCHTYQQPVDPSGLLLGSPYIGHVNEEPTLRARWVRTMQFWDLHSAIYGLMRRALVANTRLLQVCISADLVFIAELIIHGHIIQVPEALAWKRRPVSMSDYRTPEAMLAYLGGSGYRQLRMPRMEVFRQCLRGLKHAQLAKHVRRQLYRDTLGKVYLGQHFWLYDLIDCTNGLLGPDRYQRWARPIKTALGRYSPSG